MPVTAASLSSNHVVVVDAERNLWAPARWNLSPRATRSLGHFPKSCRSPLRRVICLFESRQVALPCPSPLNDMTLNCTHSTATTTLEIKVNKWIIQSSQNHLQVTENTEAWPTSQTRSDSFTETALKSNARPQKNVLPSHRSRGSKSSIDVWLCFAVRADTYVCIVVVLPFLSFL